MNATPRQGRRALTIGLVVLMLAGAPTSGATAAGPYPAGASARTASQPRPMTPGDVVAARRISSPRLAPDGDRVLFVVRSPDLEANRVDAAIWMYDDGHGEAQPLTHVAAAHSAPAWSPDGATITFLSDRDDTTRLWALPVAGGEARPLTPEGVEVADYRWSPAGDSIAYTASAVPPEGERARQDAGDDEFVFDEPADLLQLWWLDPATAEVRQVTTSGLSIQEMAFASDGSRLVVAARPSRILDRIGETELYLVDPDSGELTRLTDNAAVEGAPVFTADGSGVLFVAADAERFVNAESKLFRLDLATGAVAPVAAGYPYGLSDPLPGPEGRVRMLAGVGTSRRLVDVMPDGTVVERFATPGTVAEHDTFGARAGRAFVFTDATRLPELWLWRPGEEAPAAVTDLNPQQAEWALGATEVIEWTSADGSRVEGLLTLPPGHTPGERHPLVVKLHGGPEAAETLAHAPSYIDYHQVLAGAGWAVLRPNYRGGTGYGDAWVQGMNGDTGGGDYEDIMSGVDEVIARGVADPERMAVMGWSWGGISTGWIVTQTHRFRAASAGAMVSNHFSVFGQADLTFDVEHFYIGGSPWEDPERYLSMSPIGHVTKARTPTLLLHGAADERCPLPQSVEFYKGLRSAGVTAQLVVYPREPHVFNEPRHWLDKMEREMEWFTTHVLDAPAAAASAR